MGVYEVHDLQQGVLPTAARPAASAVHAFAYLLAQGAQAGADFLQPRRPSDVLPYLAQRVALQMLRKGSGDGMRRQRRQKLNIRVGRPAPAVHERVQRRLPAPPVPRAQRFDQPVQCVVSLHRAHHRLIGLVILLGIDALFSKEEVQVGRRVQLVVPRLHGGGLRAHGSPSEIASEMSVCSCASARKRSSASRSGASSIPAGKISSRWSSPMSTLSAERDA